MKIRHLRLERVLGTLLWVLAGLADRGFSDEHGQTDTVVRTVYDYDAGSLRSVIAQAAPGATITFDPILNHQVITLTEGAITIDKNINILGLAGGSFDH
jgi:hypothetical protein